MQKFRKLLTDNSGFTLIELLVVIAVLGILAAIAIPRLSGVTNKAKYSQGEAALESFRSYANMYFTEKGTSSSPTADDIVTEYSNASSFADTLTGDWATETVPDPITTASSIVIQNTPAGLTMTLNLGNSEITH